jgi:hypothetical protein
MRQTAIGPAYFVPAGERPMPPPPGLVLSIASVGTSRNPEDAEALIDGRLDTRWESDRPQEPGEDIRLRLAQASLVSRIEMDLGGVERGYPRRLRISVSTSDEGRRVVWEGKLGGRALTAAFVDPRRGPVAIDLPEPVTADRVELTLLGRDPDDPWSAAEIRVVGTR